MVQLLARPTRSVLARLTPVAVALLAAIAAPQPANADPVAPINAQAPSIVGEAAYGLTAQADKGEWSGAEPISYAYQWRRCDEDGAACADIAQATTTLYRPTDADLDHTLRVVVTAHNAVGDTSAASVQTDVVGNGDAQDGAPDDATRYAYDAAGRLTSMVGLDLHAAPGEARKTAVFKWDAVGNLLQIDRGVLTVPQVDDVTPGHGAAGTKVTLTGSGLSASLKSTTVTLGGVSAHVLDASPTKVVVVVPGAATTGAFVVTGPAGSASSAESFTVDGPPAPAITGYSPQVARASAEITINGHHFAETLQDNVVTVNGRRAELVSGDATHIVIRVPPFIGGAPVKVSTPDGETTGPDVFIANERTIAGHGVAEPANVTETGRLVDGVPRAVSLASGKSALLHFDAVRGEHVSFRIAGATAGAFMGINGPAGKSFWSEQYPAGDSWIDEFVAPLDGTYTVSFAAWELSLPALDLTATLWRQDQEVQAVTPSAAGTTVTATTSHPGANPGFRMHLNRGAKVAVKTSNSGFDYFNLRWISSTGVQLAASPTFGRGDALYDGVVVPSTGDWTLQADPQGPATGSVDLTFYDSTDPTVDGDFTPAGHDVHVTTTVPGQDVIATFHAEAGDRVSVNDLASGSEALRGRLQIISPTGASLENVSLADGWFIEPKTLPVTGDYKILADGEGMRAGEVHFKYYKVPDTETIDVHPDADGDATDIEFPTPGQQLRLHVTMQPGERITFTDQNSDIEYVFTHWESATSSWIDAPLIRTSSGLAYRGDQRFDQGGDYYLILDPAGARTGSLTLKLFDSTDATGSFTPSASGTAVAATSAVYGQNVVLTFAGTAGDRIASVGAGNTYNRCCYSATMYAPNGQAVSWLGSESGSYAQPVTLPQTGTYTLVVDPYWEITGTSNLTIYKVDPDVQLAMTPTATGTPTEVQTGLGQDVDVAVTVTAGQRVAAIFDGPRDRLNASWTNPIGNVTWDSWLDWAGGRFVDAMTLPDAGVWHLRSRPTRPQTGPTSVRVFDATDQVVPLTEDQTETVTIPTPGQNARLTFDADSGDHVRIDTDNVDVHGEWYPGYYNIYAPNGASVGSWGINNGSTSTNTGPGALTFDAAQTGTYTVVIDPWGPGIGHGDYTLSLTTPGARAAAATAGVARAAATPAKPSPKAARTLPRSTRKPEYATLRAYLRGSRTEAPAPHRAAPATKSRFTTLHDYFTARASGAPKPKAHAAPKAAIARTAAKTLAPELRRHSTYPEVWVPTKADRTTGWSTRRQASTWTAAPALQGQTGETAVAGQALKLNGDPLPGATVTISGSKASAVTDDTGRFLLKGAVAGTRTVRVDGGTASTKARRYGSYEIALEVAANVTTTLPATVWVTRLDAHGSQDIPTVTQRAVTLTNPRIPGFQVRIPAGSRVTDAHGRPVHDLNLTPVPLDRPPFPLPNGVEVASYFTVQPGGAYFSKGARIIYPNYMHAPAGGRVTFWDYDSRGRGWFVYGKGRVSEDGRSLVPDPGVRVWRLTGAMADAVSPRAPKKGPEGPTAGDPVDIPTGLMMHTKTDLTIGSGSSAFALTRTYRPGDDNMYEFGRGFASPFDTRLRAVASAPNCQAINLVMSTGGTYRFNRVSGNSCATAVLEAVRKNGPLAGSKLVASPMPGYEGFVLNLSDGSKWEFLRGFRPISAWVTPQGDRTEISWVESVGSWVELVTLPDGRWIRFVWGSANGYNVIKDAYDNAGRHVSYDYDAWGRPISVTDPDGGTTQYEWNPATGPLKSITDARGIKYLKNTYDGLRVARQTVAGQGDYTFLYRFEDGQEAGVCAETQCTGPFKIPPDRTPGGNGGTGGGSSGGGSSGGSGGGGGGSTMAGDRFGPGRNAASAGDNEEGMTSSEDTKSIEEVDVTDPRGLVTKYKFDVDTGMITRVEAGDRATDYEYDGNTGQMTKMSDSLGHSTQYTHDALGRVLTETRAAGGTDTSVTHYNYSSSGQLTSVTDPLNHTTTLAYDDHRRVTSITDAAQNVSRFGYSGDSSLPTSFVGADDATTRIDYRAGDLVSVTSPGGTVIRQHVDAIGRATRTTDAYGHDSRTTYDPAGMVKSVTDGKGRKTSFEHDGNGNLTAYVDARGKRHETTYNDDDKPLVMTDPNGNETHLEYGDGGALAAVESRGGKRTELRHNLFGDLTFMGYGATEHEDGTHYASTVEYTYDAAGRPTHIADSANPDTDLTWTVQDQLASTTADGHTIGYNYDLAGRRASLVSGGNVLASYGYDALNHVTQIDQGGATVSAAYDGAGRPTDITYPGGYVLHNAYDVNGALTLREVARGGTTLGAVAYAYDALGRRVASWGSLDTTRLPDALSQGTFDDDNRLTSRGGRTYTYDGDGRLLGDGDRQLSWNARGQLASVTAAGTTYDLDYDTQGRRTALSSTAGTNLGFRFDGGNELTRTDGSSSTSSVNGLGLDELLVRGDVARFAGLDGTPAAAGDASGTLTSSPATDVLGRAAATPAAAQPGWKSGAQDAAGLINFRNRYYDTRDARFVSQDPLGLGGGSTDLYAFADGDPVNGSDPTGLSFLSSAVSSTFGAAQQVGLAGLNFAYAAADEISMGELHKKLGLEACGAFGQLGHWAGTAFQGAAVAGFMFVGAELFIPATAAFLIAGGTGGLMGYLASNHTLEQPGSFWGGALATSLGVTLGPAVYVGAFLKSEWLFDNWAIAPYVGALGIGQAVDGFISNVAMPSYGAGLRRKC